MLFLVVRRIAAGNQRQPIRKEPFMKRTALILLLFATCVSVAQAQNTNSPWKHFTPSTELYGENVSDGISADTKSRYGVVIYLLRDKRLAALEVYRGKNHRVQMFLRTGDYGKPEWFVTQPYVEFRARTWEDCARSYSLPGNHWLNVPPERVPCAIPERAAVSEETDIQTMQEVQALLASLPDEYRSFFRQLR